MILVALGANLPGPTGTPAQALSAACKAMTVRGLAIVRASHIWRSAPIPASNQPWFCNAVVSVKTALPPTEIIETLQEIESDFGRVRVNKNDARVLDLDLIACNGEIMNTPNLTLPHPRLHERAFVLMPLREVAPGWVHPVLNKSVVDLIAALPPQEIELGEALL